MENKLITIIIASLNSSQTIEDCINSINAQTYTNTELIIIDGASTDGTIDILKKNNEVISTWISEPDHGIYDAWNKAIHIAKGDYICFLGADDQWKEKRNLEKLVATAKNNNYPDIISGKVEYLDEKGNSIKQHGQAWDFKKMQRWMILAHPGMLHHKRLFQKFGQFDSSLSIAGDYEFLLRLGQQTKHVFLDEVLVLAGSLGVSQTNPTKAFKENYSIQSKLKRIGRLNAIFNYIIAYSKYLIRKIIK